jgi:hypothetical protein
VHRLFAPVIAPLVEALRPRVVAEIGAGSGRLTRRLLEAVGAAPNLVHAIDPAPALDPELRAAMGGRLQVHEDRSIAVLGTIGPVDLALLDGDPNWHAVHSDLSLLARSAERADRPAPLIVVHNIHWPFGRRDGYYDPAAIPPASLHARSELGLVPGRREPSEDGLRLVPWVATRDFEPRSGVLTAVESFVADSELEWTTVELPGFNGVAVLAEARLLERTPALAGALRDLGSSRFLRRQARRAESARLAAEQELATAKRWEGGAEQEPAPEDREPTPEPEPTPAEPQDVGSLVELARERARREALEVRLGQLEGDLAARAAQLAGLTTDRDAEREAAIESRLRLEHASERLRVEREAIERLRISLDRMEKAAEEQRRELEEAIERARLSEGRLAHSRDLAETMRHERDQLHGRVERLQADLDVSQATLEEVAGHLRLAGGTRRARALRWLAKAARAATFRSRQPGPLEQAGAAAEERLLSTPGPPPPGEEPDFLMTRPLAEDRGSEGTLR